MSQEVYRIVKKMDIKNAETQLALQCAPLISGLKQSNLLIVQNSNSDYVNTIINQTGIECFILFKDAEKTTFLLYRKKQLSLYLSNQEVYKLLLKLGYKHYGLNSVLTMFQRHYEQYMYGEKSFPHEMGLLLGYPVEDVIGFIENKGKNFLYTGYWKVYGNLNEKVQMFKKFDEAKEIMIKLVSLGLGAADIIKIYSDNKMQNAAV